MSGIILKTIIIFSLTIAVIFMLVAFYLVLINKNNYEKFFIWCLGILGITIVISISLSYFMLSNKQDVNKKIEENKDPVSINYIIYNYKEYANAGIYIDNKKVSIEKITFCEVNNEKKIVIKTK